MVEILEQSKLNNTSVGVHGIADISGVKMDKLKDSKYLMNNLRVSLLKAHFTILEEKVIKFPGIDSGVTGIFVLSESHAAFHSYPEYKYIGVDIFSCGKSNPIKAIKYFSKLINADRCIVESVERGLDLR